VRWAGSIGAFLGTDCEVFDEACIEMNDSISVSSYRQVCCYYIGDWCEAACHTRPQGVLVVTVGRYAERVKYLYTGASGFF
jgi:hypothetical protein